MLLLVFLSYVSLTHASCAFPGTFADLVESTAHVLHVRPVGDTLTLPCALEYFRDDDDYNYGTSDTLPRYEVVATYRGSLIAGSLLPVLFFTDTGYAYEVPLQESICFFTTRTSCDDGSPLDPILEYSDCDAWACRSMDDLTFDEVAVLGDALSTKTVEIDDTKNDDDDECTSSRRIFGCKG